MITGGVRRRVRDWLSLLACTLVFAGTLTGPMAASAAAPCTYVWKNELKKYINSCTGQVRPAASGNPITSKKDTGPPPCNLHGNFTFCEGTSGTACGYLAADPADKYYVAPPGKQPPGSTAYYKVCSGGTIPSNIPIHPMRIPSAWRTSVWLTPAQAGIDLSVQARRAVGSIKLPKLQPVTSPALMTAVNAQTMWWANGASSAPVKGSSAMGLVATATPESLVIDPGGEEPELRCPWTISATQAAQSCSMAYTKSSIDGTATYKDQPAFTVSMRGRWKLTFAVNGVPVTFANVPDTIDGPPAT
ncbi:MAG: hypothetical protein ACRC0L_05210, partial [Angustibacter sp.]